MIKIKLSTLVLNKKTPSFLNFKLSIINILKLTMLISKCPSNWQIFLMTWIPDSQVYKCSETSAVFYQAGRGTPLPSSSRLGWVLVPPSSYFSLHQPVPEAPPAHPAARTRGWAEWVTACWGRGPCQPPAPQGAPTPGTASQGEPPTALLLGTSRWSALPPTQLRKR